MDGREGKCFDTRMFWRKGLKLRRRQTSIVEEDAEADFLLDWEELLEIHGNGIKIRSQRHYTLQTMQS